MENLTETFATYKDLTDNPIVAYFFMTLVVAGIAQGKNRSGLGWGLLCCIIVPPIVLLILLIWDKKRVE